VTAEAKGPPMVLTRFEVAERVIEHFALPRFTGATQPDAALVTTTARRSADRCGDRHVKGGLPMPAVMDVRLLPSPASAGMTRFPDSPWLRWSRSSPNSRICGFLKAAAS
jgi:hypothetical protein